jgi:hypothetical protein
LRSETVLASSVEHLLSMNRIEPKRVALFFTVFLIIGCATTYIVEGGSWLWMAPTENTRKKPGIPPSAKRFVLSRENEWSEPTEYMESYKSHEWRVESGEAEEIFFRDPDAPENVIKITQKHTTLRMERIQWMARGLKGGRPLVIRFWTVD